jgi:hypothetical protein
MFRIFLFSILFISALGLRASKPDSARILNHHIGLEIGIHHNYLFGQKYFPPDPYNYNTLYFGGYEDTFGWGAHASFFYQVRYKFVFWESGFSYFGRGHDLVCNRDSVIKYTPADFFDHAVISSELTYNNLEIPLFLGMRIKWFSISGGFRFVCLTVLSGKVTRVDYTKAGGSRLLKTSRSNLKTISGLRMEFEINRKVVPLAIYAGFDYRFGHKQFDFQAGLRGFIKL